MQNEFSKYSLEELESKKIILRKRQVFIMIVSSIVILILAITAIVKKNNQVFQLVPFLLISGLALPYFVFTPMFKKIQSEIESRGNNS